LDGVEGQSGAFIVKIAEAIQDPVTKKWSYQVTQSDGVEYNNGEWISETRLSRN
jgi:hypothetical protein